MTMNKKTSNFLTLAFYCVVRLLLALTFFYFIVRVGDTRWISPFGFDITVPVICAAFVGLSFVWQNLPFHYDVTNFTSFTRAMLYLFYATCIIVFLFITNHLVIGSAFILLYQLNAFERFVTYGFQDRKKFSTALYFLSTRILLFVGYSYLMVVESTWYWLLFKFMISCLLVISIYYWDELSFFSTFQSLVTLPRLIHLLITCLTVLFLFKVNELLPAIFIICLFFGEFFLLNNLEDGWAKTDYYERLLEVIKEEAKSR